MQISAALPLSAFLLSFYVSPVLLLRAKTEVEWRAACQTRFAAVYCMARNQFRIRALSMHRPADEAMRTNHNTLIELVPAEYELPVPPALTEPLAFGVLKDKAHGISLSSPPRVHDRWLLEDSGVTISQCALDRDAALL